MPNVFVNIPVPTANGVGAAVDVAATGALKTITVQGAFGNGTVTAAIIVEFSIDGGVTFFPAVQFSNPGKQTIKLAAQFMRVRVANANTLVTANCDMGANDNGGRFASLPASAGNGVGAPVDVSLLGTFNTFTATGVFSGTVIIEISQDGVDYVPSVLFGSPGAQSKNVVARFARVRRSNVGATAGLPIVNVAAINDATPVNSIAATWGEPGSARYFAVDYDAGSDTNIGFSDVDMASAGAVAIKTLEHLREILPTVGNGRVAVVCVAARAGGAVYRNIADTADDELRLVGIVGYELVLVRGTGDVPTAGAVKFANDTADKIALGAQIYAGTNAAGYNPVAPITASAFDVQLDGGGAPGLAAEPTLVGKRIRFDSATTTVALQNVCAMIHANDTDTITVAKNLPATPVAADIFYIEEPATSLSRIQVAGCQGATTALLPSFSPTGIAIVGFRSPIATAGFVAVGCRSVQAGLRLSFIESYSPGFSATTISNSLGLTVNDQYIDELATTILSGVGMVSEGWMGTVSTCESIFCSSIVSRLGRWQVLNIGPGAFSIGTTGGCYFGAGMLFQNCKGSGATENTVGGSVLGSNGSASIRRSRLQGGFAGSCISITNTFMFIRGLDTQNVGGLSILSVFGIGTIVAINDMVGSTGNTGFGLDMTLNRNSLILMAQITANTFTGAAGQDIVGAGPIFFTHADSQRTDLTDKFHNLVQGDASTKTGNVFSIANDGVADIGQYKIVRATGNGVVQAAQADTAANADGVVGICQTAFTTVQESVIVASGGTWLQFDAGPTVGNIAYLSTATLGNAQDTIPAAAATNQKLRLGRILRVSGTLGFVELQIQTLAVLADGAA